MSRATPIWLFDVVAVCLIALSAPVSWLWLDAARPADLESGAAAATAVASPAPIGSQPAATPEPSPTPSPSFMTGDGTWRGAGPLPFAVWGTGVAVLRDGRVLAVGGTTGPSSTKAVAATELFDPAKRTWTAGAPMLQARAYPTTVALPDGSVLVVGGARSLAPLDTAERFYPDSGTWISAGRMENARVHATATLLQDGRVLVAGGALQGAPQYTASATAEIYDPKTGNWTPVADMSVPRVHHIAALLPTGEVLVAGGADKYGTSAGTAYASAEIFDPRGDTWRPAAPLSVQRYAATATTTDDGRVLVAGGWFNLAAQSPSLSTAEAYDPTTNRWMTVGPMSDGRGQARMTALADGRVLIVGGDSSNGPPAATAELYDPNTRTWQPTGPLPAAVIWPILAALPDGRAVIAGGALDSAAKSATTASAMLAPPARAK